MNNWDESEHPRDENDGLSARFLSTPIYEKSDF